jgi:hypothetical protein
MSSPPVFFYTTPAAVMPGHLAAGHQQNEAERRCKYRYIFRQFHTVRLQYLHYQKFQVLGGRHMPQYRMI